MPSSISILFSTLLLLIVSFTITQATNINSLIGDLLSSPSSLSLSSSSLSSSSLSSSSSSTTTSTTTTITTTNPPNQPDDYVQFDISLHPTSKDHDYRTYFQGNIQVSNELGYSGLSWTLDIISLENKDISNIFVKTKGLLVPWSPWFNSDNFCSNTVLISAKTNIFSCNNQRFVDGSSFAGSFHWDGAYQNIGKLLFRMSLTIDYLDPSKRSETRVFEETRDLVIVDNAGILTYANLDAIGNNSYILQTSFKTSVPFNAFAFRPYGTLAAFNLAPTLQCTVNGIDTTPTYRHSTPSQYPSEAGKQMTSAHLFSILPLSTNNYVPYSTLKDPNQILAIPAGVHITIRCTFTHDYKFYADGFPYGLSIQFANLASAEPFENTQISRITTLLAGPTWFIPRFPASTASGLTKVLRPTGVYYSGIMPLYQKGRLGQSIVELTAIYQLNAVNGRLTCQGSTSKVTNLKAFQLLTLLEHADTFTLKTSRYSIIGPNQKDPSKPFIESKLLTAPHAIQDSTTYVHFDGLDFCSIIDHPDFPQDSSSTLRIVLQFGLLFTPKHAEDTEQYKTISEYPTPNQLSPHPPNIIFVLKQPQEGDNLSPTQNYQPTTLSWSSNYQLKATEPTLFPILEMPIKRHPKGKEKNSTQSTFLFSFHLKPMDITHSILIFWFPTGFKFIGDFNTTTTCTITPSTSTWTPTDSQHSQTSPPYPFHYNVDHSGIALRGSFERATYYLIECQELVIAPLLNFGPDSSTQLAMGLFALPKNSNLLEFLAQSTNTGVTNDTLLQYVFKGYFSDYQIPHTIPILPPEIKPLNIPKNSVTTIAHFTQIPIEIPREPVSRLLIAMIIIFSLLAVILIILGIYLWKRKNNQKRTNALMVYYNYDTSVQEYL